MAGRVTEVLEELRRGTPGAREELLRLVYEELHRLASISMNRQPPGHTLQTTALVHEAYLRLMGGREVAWQNRAHFLGTAARAMRSILVDMARAQKAQKRGGQRLRVTLHDDVHGARETPDDVLAVHEALAKLEKIDERKTRVVELRFFGGLSIEETARVLEVSERTVQRMWEHARAWLYREITS